MAKSAHSWALPVAIIGIWALLREVKTIKMPTFPDFPEWPKFQITGTQDALDKQSEQLQVYEQQRIADASRIEAERASIQLKVGNYGTVDGSQGAWTGSWYNTEGKGGDSCHVVSAGAQSSAGWRMFTGQYCRDARSQGLIE